MNQHIMNDVMWGYSL